MAAKKPAEQANPEETVAKSDYDHTDLPSDVDEPEEVTPPVAEAAAPVEAPVEPAKPTHPPGMRSRAIRFGISEEQLRGLSTDELADWLLELQTDEATRVAAQQQQPPPAKEEEDGLGLDSMVDPTISAAMKKLAKENKELKLDQAKRDQRETARIQRQSEDAYDDGFDSLPAPLKKIFGEGDGRSLPPGSKELIRRNAALRSAGIDPSVDSPLAIKRKLTKAANALYGDLVTAPAPPATPAAEPGPYDAATKPNGARITKEQWEAGALAKPTNAAPAKPVKGEAAAREAVKEHFRRFAISDEDEAEQLKNVPE